MSLYTEAQEACVMLRKAVSEDGYGGHTDTWTEGQKFDAAVVCTQQVESRPGEAADVSSLYTVTTGRSFCLKYHDVFRRIRDGKIFRVTSDGDDKYTPKSSGLDMRQVTAEEWWLNNG